MSQDFTPEQKRYLEGFVSGATAARAARGLPGVAPVPAAASPGAHEGPDAIHFEAQDRVVAEGGKLVDQEKWKRVEHPFDAWPRLCGQADRAAFPKPDDNFRWRYYGLFYVAPAQNSYMCRLRIPNGILKHWQFAGLADLAEARAGGFAHVTTRANLQIREIAAENAVHVVEGILDLGLCSRGSGADNIRNVTGTPTAGIDPQELIDTRPFARAWHHHILNDRSLFGLPRKFNVAFDGAGRIPVLEDTNDIGFQAVEIDEAAPVDSGIWFRLALGGITGHRDLARDTGVVVKPADATRVADAVVRVFIRHGDRTNRNRSRLKYVLDAWGFEAFLTAVEAELGAALTRIDAAHVKPRPDFDRHAHIGVHPQKQPGLNWIGVVLPLGKMTGDQIRALSAIARDLGDGDIRLTVWQNLLISGIPDACIGEATARIEAARLGWQASSVRAGLVACTGSKGCKFAASDTKGHAAAIADWCDGRVELDVPINIHLTGCHHSCAQHYIGDIGLIGAKVDVSEDESVEGYHLFVGGGFGAAGAIGRELIHDLKADEAPRMVERILCAYLARRDGPHESFHAFANRHDVDALKGFIAETEA